MVLVVDRLPAELACQRRAARRRAGGDRRHTRCPAAARIFDQLAHAVRPGARDRHRRRRCDRGRRERGAENGRRLGAAGRGARSDGRGHAPDHLDHARVVRGVRSGGIPGRHRGPVLPAVRDHDRRINGHLDDQFADVVTRAGRRCCCGRGTHRRMHSSARSIASSAGSSARSIACLRAGRNSYGHGVGAHSSGDVEWCWRAFVVLLVATWFMFRIVPGGFIPAQDKQYLLAHRATAECGFTRSHRSVMRQMSKIAMRNPGRRSTRSAFRACRRTASSISTTRRSMFLPLKDFDERSSKELAAGDDRETTQRAGARDRAMQLSSSFPRHPCRDSAPRAASSCTFRIGPPAATTSSPQWSMTCSTRRASSPSCLRWPPTRPSRTTYRS